MSAYYAKVKTKEGKSKGITTHAPCISDAEKLLSDAGHVIISISRCGEAVRDYSTPTLKYEKFDELVLLKGSHK